MKLRSFNCLWLTFSYGLSLTCLGVINVHAENELTNGGFETPETLGTDLLDAGAPWVNFGPPSDTRFTTDAQALSGIQSLKTFGPFDFIGGGTGATQKIPAMENSPYQAEVFAQQITGDELEGLNFGVYKIEFLDANMDLVAGLDEPAGTPLLGFNFFESEPINASTPVDTWTQLDASGFSPPGTEFVQAVVVQVQLGDGDDNFTGGAIYWDDAFVMKGLAGDFDEDGDVDGYDFLAWQHGESPNPLGASDLAAWEVNYGKVANPITATSAVPEPSSIGMAALGLMGLGSVRWCRGSGVRR